MKAVLLALAQLDDPAMLGVLLRSVALSLLAYGALIGGSLWAVHTLLAGFHVWGWVAAVLGTVGVAVLAFFLFLPTVMLIAALYSDRVAAAVDRRHYPHLPPLRPASLAAQAWDGVVLAGQVLLANIVALLLAMLPIPGLGLALSVLVSGWAIGRGLFVAVAMRRMGRRRAQACYRERRWAVLLPGLLLAGAAYLPGINLLVPIVGVAAMVHVLHGGRRQSWQL